MKPARIDVSTEQEAKDLILQMDAAKPGPLESPPDLRVVRDACLTGRTCSPASEVVMAQNPYESPADTAADAGEQKHPRAVGAVTIGLIGCISVGVGLMAGLDSVLHSAVEMQRRDWWALATAEVGYIGFGALWMIAARAVWHAWWRSAAWALTIGLALALGATYLVQFVYYAPMCGTAVLNERTE